MGESKGGSAGRYDPHKRPNDIRPVKQELRRKYRAIRETMDPSEKDRQDAEIFERLSDLAAYRQAKTLLCFVSTPIEVDTTRILCRAFAEKKTVAVPKCLDRRGNMDFFIIHSLSELSAGVFSLLEPDVRKAKRLESYTDSICILPAFAFDPMGYRLGFGMGYYDRFLRRYTGVKVGVCYNSCIAPSLPRGRFDEAADFIVTSRYVLTVQKTKNAKENHA